MNLLFSCIGKRGYLAEFFRPGLTTDDRIVGTSNTEWTPSFRCCDTSYLLPDIDDDDYLPAVKEVCQRERIDALFSCFDPDVHRLSSHLEELREVGVTPVVPTPEVADVCFDKYATYSFLRRHGISTATTFIDLASARRAIRDGDLAFPVYVKPRRGFGSRNTFLARNELQLEAFFHYESDMVVQERLVGEALNVDMLNDLSGRVVSVVLWRKLLSRLGETEQAITCHRDDVLEFAEHLGNLLGNIGPLDADLFVDDRGVHVLELNPRFGGGYPVSHLAGADFPGQILRMLRGQAVEPRIGDYTDGVVMMKDNLVVGGERADYFQSVNLRNLREADRFDQTTLSS